jgi:hypothetical protein
MMTMRRTRSSGFSNGVAAALWALPRLALVAFAGLVVLLATVVFGVVIGAAVLAHRLTGGRRARTAPVAPGAPGRRARPARSDVIDVEARDLP